MNTTLPSKDFFINYGNRLQASLAAAEWSEVAHLGADIYECWLEKRQVFICGNGGSAGNAIHLANDFLYGIAKRPGGGLRVNALSSNASVITCLANDIGYDRVFAEQLSVMANPNDLLLEQAKTMNVKSYAILGFSGGRSKQIADVPIHFPIDDMQVAEDLQLIIGHMLMQWLYENRPKV
jgi:D-sedoheptulose 7-phosphate isomerase